MIEVDPIEVVMRARKKCPGYVGTWTLDALEERRETIRQLEVKIKRGENETLQSGTPGSDDGAGEGREGKSTRER